MKRIITGALALCMTGCVSLCYQEKQDLAYLKANGIDVNHGRGGFEAPNSVWGAGVLNLLPGFGNFYLAFGRGNDSAQGIYGALNLLLWPIGIVWSVPQAVVDAKTLNEREMLYYYRHEKGGREEMSRSGLKFE